ncbi:MAG: phage tail assembly protein [Bauldia sp.]
MATTLKLARPVNHDGKTYESVEIDEPTVGAIRAFEKAAREEGEIAGMVAMLALDLGWPQDAVAKIRASDFKRISDAMAPFVEALKPAEPPTGEPSAPTS